MTSAVAAQLQPVVDVVERSLGIRCRGARADIIGEVLVETMQREGHHSPSDYAARLATDADARASLAEALRIPETYFLREPAQLTVLAQQVLPALAAANPDRDLRVWSAGCSSGEEAYTLAIVGQRAGVGDRLRILATDRSESAVASATAGVYAARSLRKLDRRDRDRWFTHRSDRSWAVDDRLRAHVQVRRHDLVAEPFPGELDLIVCRNVLLYLTEAHVAGVVRRLAAALAPGGWLVLGSADPAADVADRLVRVPNAGAAIYRRPGRHDADDSHVPGRTASLAPQTPARAASRQTTPPASGQTTPPASGQTTPPASGQTTPPASGQTTPPASRQTTRPIPGRGDEQRERALDPLLHVRLAMDLLDAADAAGARRALTAALFLDPELAAGHLLLGQAALALGDAAGAAHAFQDAARLLDGVPATATVPASPLPAGRLRAAALAGQQRAEQGSRP